MVDVHILTLPDTNQEWLSDCLNSLKNEPVRIHICDGIVGDIAQARTQAFALGNFPYVAFVDPDDLIVPGIFKRLIHELDNHPDCVCAYSDEVLIDDQGRALIAGWSVNPEPFISSGHDLSYHNINGQYIHHLRVMRRDAVVKCLPLKTKRMCEPALLKDLAKLGTIRHCPGIGYLWRIHDGNTFSTYTDEEKAECLSC